MVDDVREDVVRRLMHAANHAMMEVTEQEDTTSAEVFSAYFTMARVALIAAREQGVSEVMLRQVVGVLWAECGDEEVLH